MGERRQAAVAPKLASKPVEQKDDPFGAMIAPVLPPSLTIVGFAFKEMLRSYRI